MRNALSTLHRPIEAASDHLLARRTCAETFDGEVGIATGPDNATGKFKTKLSASGLVYKHYGREILCVLQPKLANAPADLDWVYDKLYVDFMEGIDANDNGIEVADEVRYKELTSLPHRVARLNSRWNAPPGGPSEDENFATASTLCGNEFAAALEYIGAPLGPPARLEPRSVVLTCGLRHSRCRQLTASCRRAHSSSKPCSSARPRTRRPR